jgi:hypothetical protein
MITPDTAGGNIPGQKIFLEGGELSLPDGGFNVFQEIIEKQKIVFGNQHGAQHFPSLY